MTFLSHLAVSIGLFISGLFGGHSTVSSAALTTHQATSTSSVTSTTSVQTHAAVAAKAPSFLSSIESIGSSIIKPAVPTNTTSSAPVTTVPSSSITTSTAVASGNTSPGVNKIDQTTAVSSVPNSDVDAISDMSSTISFSGHSSNAAEVDVALADTSEDPTDWDSVSAEPTAHIGNAAVTDGVWSVQWKGIPQGNYNLFVYDSSSHALLVKGSLQVSAPPSFSFTTAPAVPTTLGLGQMVTDGNVFIKLNSISANGSAVLSVNDTANDGGSFFSNTFTVTQGTNLPSTGIGFDDLMVPTHARSIYVSSISTSLKTVVLTTSYVTESPRADGEPR